jgi:UDP-2,3-diacylglucosamine hydrolase
MAAGNIDVASDKRGPLGVICGGGSLPYTVADAAIANGRPVVLLAITGFADAEAVARYPHHWVALGQFGRLRRLAREAQCRDIVFVGTLVRPAIAQIRLDLLTLRLLPRIIRTFRGGDDHLLSGIGKIFEEHGFRLVGAHEVAPQILAPEGAFGRRAPSEEQRADINLGIAFLRAIGPFDVGQAVVIAQARVLAVEAADGTDLMLDHIADLRGLGRIRVAAGKGVLVKAAKPQQDRRFDLPSIGPRTVEGVARAGLGGLAVLAGEAIVAEPQDIIAAADRHDVFVVGVNDAGNAS